MLIAGALGPRTALNTLISSTAASVVMCFITLRWFAWSSAHMVPGKEDQEPCSVGLVSVSKSCSYAAAVYSAVVLFAAGASGPAGWFPREQLMPALVGGWVVLVVVGFGGYLRWRALHPVAVPLLPRPLPPAPSVADLAPSSPPLVAAKPPPPPPLFTPGAPYGDMNAVRGYKCCAWTLALEEAARAAPVQVQFLPAVEQRRPPMLARPLAPPEQPRPVTPPAATLPPAPAGGGLEAAAGAACRVLVKGEWVPAVVVSDTEEAVTVKCTLPDGRERTVHLRKPVDATKLVMHE